MNIINANNDLVFKFEEGEGKNYNKFTMLFIFIQIQLLVESAPKGLRWSKEFVVFSSFIIIAVVFLHYLFFKRGKVIKSSLGFLIVVFTGSSLAVLLNQDFNPDNFIFMSVVASGFFICNVFYLEDYLESYLITMIIYSVYSLVATYTLLPLVMQWDISLFSSSDNFLGTPFLDMGLAFSVKWDGLMRNQGIFREPGVFQFFLLVALVVEMFFVRRKIKPVFILVLTITLITTFSTTGYFCSIPLLLAFFIKDGSKICIKNLFLVLAIIFGLLLLINLSEESSFLFSRSINKVGQDTDNISTLVRGYSILNVLEMSLYSPIWGSSFCNGLTYIVQNFNDYGTDDVTGTMFIIIMGLGYPIGFWCNINFYKFCSLFNKNIYVKSLIFISLFLSLNTQNLINNTLLWTVIFMPYMKKRYLN